MKICELRSTYYKFVNPNKNCIRLAKNFFCSTHFLPTKDWCVYESRITVWKMIYAFQSWGLNPPSQNAPMVVNNLQQINNKLGKSAVFQLCLTIAWANSKVVQPHTIRRLPEKFLFFFAFEGKRGGSSSSSQIVKHIFSIHKTCSSNNH